MRRLSQLGQGEKAAIPLVAVPAGRLCRTAAGRHRVQLHAGPHLRPVCSCRALRTTPRSSRARATFPSSGRSALRRSPSSCWPSSAIPSPMASCGSSADGRMLLTLLFTIPLFVSENIRLYGWVLFLIKNGVLLGSLKSMFGLELESIAVHPHRHPARHGLCLFALHAVSHDARHLHGAERNPRCRLRSRRLALAGVQGNRAAALHAGHRDRLPADLRSRGGRHCRGQGHGRADGSFPITHDIEIAFTYAQNWPLGAALAVLLMLVVGVLVLLALRRFDLDRFLGRR